MSNYYRLMNRQGGQRYCCYQLDLDHSQHYLDHDNQVVTLGCKSARLQYATPRTVMSNLSFVSTTSSGTQQTILLVIRIKIIIVITIVKILIIVMILTTISIITLSSADRSTPAQSWLVNRSEVRYLVLMIMKRRQMHLQNHGEIISSIGGPIIINNCLSGGPASDADKKRPQRRRPCWDQEWVA